MLNKILLKKQFNNFNLSFPTIRFGGCGIFAELLYEKFIKFDIVPKIFIFGTKMQLEEENFFHVSLKIGNKFIDSMGTHENLLKLRKANHLPFVTQKEITLGDLLELNRKNIWNGTFDKKYIPDIKAEIDKILTL